MPIQTLHLRSSQQGKEPTPGTAAGQLPVGSIAINFNKDEPFLSIQDSAGVIRRIAGIKVSATAPASPTGGELWLDTAGPALKVFNGTTWVPAGGVQAGTGPSAPAAPAVGDIWVDTTNAGHPVILVYNGTSWIAGIIDATTTDKGLIQLATAAEVTAGVDAVKAVTPATAKVELDKKAPLNSAALTGVPTAPTAAAGTSTTQLATTEFVGAAVKAGISSGTTAPTNPVRGQTWIDTSVDPPVVKVWDDTPGPGAWSTVGASPADASETVKGIVELATAAETTTGTDNTRAVHPAGLKVELDKKLNLTGGNLTGGVTATERTVTAGAFDLATGNFWTCGAIAIPNPTNAVAGMSGLIRLTAAPAGWGTNFKHAGGSATAPKAFPAIVPFYVQDATTILVGKPVEGMA